jgi:hypothetical protein
MRYRPHEHDISTYRGEPCEDLKATPDGVALIVVFDPSEDVGDSVHNIMIHGMRQIVKRKWMTKC